MYLRYRTTILHLYQWQGWIVDASMRRIHRLIPPINYPPPLTMKTKIVGVLLLCCAVNAYQAAHAHPSAADDSAPSKEAMFERLTVLAGTGNPEVQYNLGMFYNNGIGTARDNKAAFHYFFASAKGGNLLAAYKVGCYYAGQFPGVVAHDPQAAFSYKLRAAEGGYALAQHEVAMYFAKKGDLTAMYTWLEKASRQGLERSTVYLAYHLSGDNSEDKPKGLALMLILKDQARDVPEQLAVRLAAVEGMLSADEKLQAQRIKASWMTGPTPLTAAASAGIGAVPALLRAMQR
jgi:TPR repeat protein